MTGNLTNEDELKKQLEKLTILQRVDAELTHKLDVAYVLDMALDAAMRFSRANAGGVVLVDQDTIYDGKIIGNYPAEFINAYPKIANGIVGRVLRTMQAELVTDVLSDPDYLPMIATTRAQICIPLISQERIVGLLNLETPRPTYFTEEVFDFLKIFTGRFAAAIDNSQLYQVSQQQLAELKDLYARVSGLEQLKTDMIRIAAHDLRNPLSAILGFASLLGDTELPPRQLEYARVIEKSAHRMHKIITDILSLQRIEAMQNSAVQSIANLREVIDKSYHDHQEQAQIKRQDYTLHLPDGSVIVAGDAPQLKEAVDNLVSNAIKYTPDAGQVIVRLIQVVGFARVEVEDHGYGIPEDMQEHLFQPFYRARTEETRDIDGTGLGLHLVKNIIERHNGDMVFKSVYGKGSTFGFRLPILNEIATSQRKDELIELD
jgi:signal transduction histidine kinase